MKAISYSLVVGSLMYAQVCTHLNIAFVVGVLGRYLSDPGQSHYKEAKKVLRYLQGTKNLMLTYWCTDMLGFFWGCISCKAQQNTKKKNIKIPSMDRLESLKSNNQAIGCLETVTFVVFNLL